jgi:hypothetical protein
MKAHSVALAIISAFPALYTVPCFASASYEFCVTQVSAAKVDKFGARYKFGDADPGREIARVLVSQKYKQANTTNVSVSDYNVGNCGAIREEANINMTSEQISQLGAAIARGDIPATASVALEVVTGVTVRSVVATGAAVAKGAHWVGCRVGIGC